MTGKFDFFTNIYNITPWPINLPNEKQTYVVKYGNVLLGSSLLLKNVLYIPQLTCNLLSVSQLLKHLDSTISFNAYLCAIQDHSSRTLIGASEQRNGLFYFRHIETTTFML